MTGTTFVILANVWKLESILACVSIRNNSNKMIDRHQLECPSANCKAKTDNMMRRGGGAWISPENDYVIYEPPLGKLVSAK